MHILKDLLQSSLLELKKNEIQDAKSSLDEIFAFVLNCKKADLYFMQNFKIDDKKAKKISSFIKRRSKHEPLEYILKKMWFYDSELFLTKDVLIPRPETELLVDIILKENDLNNKTVWDVCTGSGCIGIAIKKKVASAKVFLSDISKKALNVAKKNSLHNGAEVFFKVGDLLNPFKGQKADLIVCNPPYVSEEDYGLLSKEITDFEPKGAFVAKNNGFEFYQKISKNIEKYLNPKGRIYFEIGKDQADGIKNIFNDPFWRAKKIIKDLSGKNRFFLLEIE
ncbi:MAG: peptide chain release factor N(5)-glutamine methyltransferase [Chlamydiae bacterium]|nr:peptide chain release factor N(5)-glutamine methyltransferase [Chlamydiota bacterium]